MEVMQEKTGSWNSPVKRKNRDLGLAQRRIQGVIDLGQPRSAQSRIDLRHVAQNVQCGKTLAHDLGRSLEIVDQHSVLCGRRLEGHGRVIAPAAVVLNQDHGIRTAPTHEHAQVIQHNRTPIIGLRRVLFGHAFPAFTTISQHSRLFGFVYQAIAAARRGQQIVLDGLAELPPQEARQVPSALQAGLGARQNYELAAWQ